MWVAKTLKFTVEGVFRGEDKEVEGGANPCRLPAHNGEVEIPVSSRDSSCGAVLVPASQAPCSVLSLNTQAVALSPGTAALGCSVHSLACQPSPTPSSSYQKRLRIHFDQGKEYTHQDF